MKFKVRAYIGIAVMFAVSLAMPLTGYQIKAITESLTSGAFSDALDWVTLLVVTYVGINLVKFIAKIITATSVNDSINEGRLSLFEKASTLKYSDIEEMKSSKMRNIISNDSGDLCDGYYCYDPSVLGYNAVIDSNDLYIYFRL